MIYHRAEIQEATALANRDALKQVLLILLENALKYSTGRVRITAERAGEQVLILIQDEGPGIAPEALPHIFDRFDRGRLRPDVPGAGLGLAIAKALVEAQGGSIAVRSEPGWGTAVTVCLEGVFS